MWKITEATHERVTRECILCQTSDSFPATAACLLPRYIEVEQQHLLRYQQLAQAEDALEESGDREQKLQDALDDTLALLQDEEQQMGKAHTLLGQAEMLISNHDGDFSGWLTAYTAFAEKYPQEVRE